MKILVFAHVPPPHHGQSYMVQLMLNGFGGDQRKISPSSNSSAHATPHANGSARFGIACYHVNARLSRKLENIGDFRPEKVLLLVGYCLKAIWCRIRYGVTTLYYIPCPGKPSALYRDWLVMLMCRPFFKRIVLHWHAAGLAKWLETSRQIRTRAVTYQLIKNADLSIVLSRFNRADAEKIFSRQITVVCNGIPDPCKDFDQQVLPRRRARVAARRALLSAQPIQPEDLRLAGDDPHVVKVLYLAHCTREKGLFDALEGVRQANRLLAEFQSPLTLRLLVTGAFVRKDEQEDYERWMTHMGMSDQAHYVGFVSGAQKNHALRDADLFCFPTFYENENQPVNLIEAMAYGLPIVTTRWRSLPEIFAEGYPGLVDIKSPEQVAQALLALLDSDLSEQFRSMFLGKFTLEHHLTSLASAFHNMGKPPAAVPRRPAPSVAMAD